MRVVLSMATSLAMIVSLSTVAFAQMVSADVQKVDEAAGKVTLKHGPIPKFDMGEMTMVYRVKDPSMLKGVKVGDKVKFEADQIEGKYTVTTMQKSK